MAHNVKMSDLIKRIVIEAQSAFFEGLIEGMQSALNEMQTVDREPINAPMAEPKRNGFLIDVAVVGRVLDHFIEFREMLGGESITPDFHFKYKGHKFTFIDRLHDNYYQFDKVICLATYFDPLVLQIIDRIVDDKEEVSMMTPMELIELYNRL